MEQNVWCYVLQLYSWFIKVTGISISMLYLQVVVTVSFAILKIVSMYMSRRWPVSAGHGGRIDLNTRGTCMTSCG